VARLMANEDGAFAHLWIELPLIWDNVAAYHAAGDAQLHAPQGLRYR
jgi:hypothetical protein